MRSIGKILSQCAGKKACVLGHNSLCSNKCPLFSNAVTCELRGSQLPGSCTPDRKLTVGGMVGSQIMVAIMKNNLLVEPEEVCYNGGS